MCALQATNRQPRRQPAPARRSWIMLRTAWLRRYLPAEVASLAFALVGGTLAAALTGVEDIVAAVSAWSAVVGYYGMMLVGELASQSRTGRSSDGAALWPIACASARGLVLEFGGAETLDSLLFSPVLVYLCIQALPNLQLAIIASEVTSTVLFYTIVFVAHQARLALVRHSTIR
jgi:hypothetical protein